MKDLAAQLGVPEPTASRLDTGARGFNPEQIELLGRWYNLDPGELPDLLALGVESRMRAWWQQLRLADSYRTLIGMEQGAKSINEYGGSVLPGLLQTADYARAAVRGSAIDATDQEIEQAVQVRVRRQRVLEGADPPLLWVVIDESVLARTTGGVEVMAEQLAHLEEMSMRPRVTVQVIGFEVGVHIGCHRYQFILIQLGWGLPDVLYKESLSAPRDTTDTTTVEDHWQSWHQLRALALDPLASRERIRHYQSRLRTG